MKNTGIKYFLPPFIYKCERRLLITVFENYFETESTAFDLFMREKLRNILLLHCYTIFLFIFSTSLCL